MPPGSSAPAFRALTEAELHAALSGPFNPPTYSPAFTEGDFTSEYWAVHDQVEKSLSILGVHDECGNGDFCMNDNFGASRFIGIELTSKRLWRPELIPLLQSVLRRQTQPYRVYVDHDLLEEPVFFLLVHSAETAGCIPDLLHRRAFGL